MQALYTPSEEVSLRVIADYSEVDEICCGAPTYLSNNKIGAAGQPGTDTVLPLFGGTVFPGGDAFFDREVAVNILPISKMKDRGLSAELNWELSDNYSLVSLSAYRKFDSFDHIDADFTDVDFLGFPQRRKTKFVSQELRLNYNSEDLNYIVGLFYFTQDIDLDYSVYTRSLSNEFIIASAGLQPLIDAINGVSALTGGLIQPLATPAPAGTGFDHVAIQDHENYAVFGQFDYKLNDELTLTAGLRFTSENKELNTVFTEVGPGINGLDPNPANWADPVAATGVLTGLATGVIDLTTPEGLAQLAVFTPFSQPGWAFPFVGCTNPT